MKTSKLLTAAASNAKTAKNGAGVLSYILHLAPSDISGHNVCPFAVKVSDYLSGKAPSPKLSHCSLGCLNLSGQGRLARGGMVTLASLNSGSLVGTVQAARIRKTKLYFENRPAFMQQLGVELVAAMRKGRKLGLPVAVRLNGTSDLDWRDVICAYPSIQFYDYTKRTDLIIDKIDGKLPGNYYLTYSLHDGKGSKEFASVALACGINVAAVFRNKALPKQWLGYPVVNGDASDLRFNDTRGVIVGLYAKGYAKQDQTGFVIDPESLPA